MAISNLKTKRRNYIYWKHTHTNLIVIPEIKCTSDCIILFVPIREGTWGIFRERRFSSKLSGGRSELVCSVTVERGICELQRVWWWWWTEYSYSPSKRKEASSKKRESNQIQLDFCLYYNYIHITHYSLSHLVAKTWN